MIEHMDDVLTSGIDSFKIEGRMKTALYVATVARTYRKAIDDYLESSGEISRQTCPGIRSRSQAAPTVSLRQASSMANQARKRRSMTIIPMIRDILIWDMQRQ